MKIRIGAEYLTSQGDDDGGAGGDTDVETFFNLFPTNHGHMGIMDYYNMKNIQADTQMRESIGEDDPKSS